MKNNWKIGGLALMSGALLFSVFFLNQRTEKNYATASLLPDNTQPLTGGFWSANPSDTLIKETIFGDSVNFTTFYTKEWPTYTATTCDETIMNVIKISSGQKIPNILTGNNVYVVEEGTYELTGADINIPSFSQNGQILMQGSCIALVASGNVDFYSHQDGVNIKSMISSYNPSQSARAYVIDGINVYGNSDSGGNSFASSVGTGISFNSIGVNSLFDKMINNVSIYGFDIGIQIQQSNTNSIYNVTISGNNLGGIYVYNTQGIGILFSTISNNGGGSVGNPNPLFGGGIYIQGDGSIVLPIPNYTGYQIIGGNSIGIAGSTIESNNKFGIALQDVNTVYIGQSTIHTNGAYGIYLAPKSNNIAERIQIFYAVENDIQGHTIDGIHSEASLFDFISGSIIKNNDQNGIYIDKSLPINGIDPNTALDDLCDGVRYASVPNICANISTTINNNDITDNGVNGILSKKGYRHFIFENSINKNGLNGIEIGQGLSGYIHSNIIESNGGNGISGFNINIIPIYGNALLSNQEDGIYIERLYRSPISNNKIFSSQYHGVRLDVSIETHIDNNIVSNNTSGGITLLDNNSITAYNNIDNLIHNNLIFNNEIFGLLVQNDSGLNYIFNNQVFNNDNGIILSATGSAFILNNSIYNNISLGVGIIGPNANIIGGNKIYNNSVGMLFSGGSISNSYYGNELFFQNNENLSGSNGSDSIFNGVFNPTTNTTGTLNFSTGTMTCERATIPEHIPLGISNMFFSSTFPLCNTRGRIPGWSSSTGDSYTFFENIPLQIQPFILNPGQFLIPKNIMFFDTGMHIGDFFNSSTIDLEQIPFIGGTSYISNDGPFTLSTIPNTLGLKARGISNTGFTLSGGFSSIVNGSLSVIGDLLSVIISNVNGTQANGLFSLGNGLKFIRSQFTGSSISGTLVSNYYGNLRILGNAISVTKTPSSTSILPGQPISYSIFFRNDTPSTLTGIIVTDSVSTGLTYLTSTATPQITPQPPTIIGNIITRTGFTSLNPGETGEIIVNFIFNGGSNPTLFNDAIVSASGFSGTGTSSVCTNGATNPPLCNQCTAPKVYNSTTKSCTEPPTPPGCTGSCCGGGCNPPYCGNGVLNVGEECDPNDSNVALSLAPGQSCTNQCKISGTPKELPLFQSAPIQFPIGKGCMYNDYNFKKQIYFPDSISHRSFPYIQIGLLNCLWRGKYGEWQFYPGDNITRAETMKILVRIRGIDNNLKVIKEEASNIANPAYDDITSDARYGQYFVKGKELGLTQEFESEGKASILNLGSKQTFVIPNLIITRYQAVKGIMQVYRLLNKNYIPSNDFKTQFTDIKKGNEYFDYIIQAEQLGFIGGYKMNNKIYFRGNSPITRAAFAKLITIPFREQLGISNDLSILNSKVYKDLIIAFKKSKKNRTQYIDDTIKQLEQQNDEYFNTTLQLNKQDFIKEIERLLKNDQGLVMIEKEKSNGVY